MAPVVGAIAGFALGPTIGLTAATGAMIGAVGGTLLGGSMTPKVSYGASAAPPRVQPPSTMPTPDQGISEAATLSNLEQLKRRGRLSTILTEPSGGLGGETELLGD